MRQQLLLFVVSATVLFLNLGGPRLWDRDEPRNAGCAAEMLQRGDWVTPMFNDELRDHKPVLLYWFMMASYSLFGVNEFAARLPSALLAVGTIFMVFCMGRRMFSPAAGFWAAMTLASTMMFGVAGRAATPDSVLIFFTTLATTIFVLNAFPKTDQDPSEGQVEYPTRWLVVAAMYLVMGIAMLAKGPIGLVLPTAVIGMYLLIRWLPVSQPASSWAGRGLNLLRPFAPLHFLKTCWRMKPVTAVLVALAVALPWYIWVGIRTEGDWPAGFFLQHNVGRAMQSMEGHGGSVFYYPVALMVGFFPWSVFLVPLIVMLVRHFRANDPWCRGYTLAICWVAVYVGLFSIASTKLPSYITPCYPGAALLCGCFVARWLQADSAISFAWTTVGLSVMVAIGLAMLVGVPVATAELIPNGLLIGSVGAIPLLTGVACLWLHLRQRHELTGRCFATGSIGFVAIVFGFVSLAVDNNQKQHEILETIAQRSNDPNVGSYGCLEPSWVFYLKRPVFELQGKSPEHSLTRTRAWQKRPRPGIAEFLSRGPQQFVITTESAYKAAPKLPPGVVKLKEVPYFLKKEKLVLLGWSDERVNVARKP